MLDFLDFLTIPSALLRSSLDGGGATQVIVADSPRVILTISNITP